jgi:hypothetical protein
MEISISPDENWPNVNGWRIDNWGPDDWGDYGYVSYVYTPDVGLDVTVDFSTEGVNAQRSPQWVVEGIRHAPRGKWKTGFDVAKVLVRTSKIIEQRISDNKDAIVKAAGHEWAMAENSDGSLTFTLKSPPDIRMEVVGQNTLISREADCGLEVQIKDGNGWRYVFDRNVKRPVDVTKAAARAKKLLRKLGAHTRKGLWLPVLDLLLHPFDLTDVLIPGLLHRIDVPR